MKEMKTAAHTLLPASASFWFVAYTWRLFSPFAFRNFVDISVVFLGGQEKQSFFTFNVLNSVPAALRLGRQGSCLGIIQGAVLFGGAEVWLETLEATNYLLHLRLVTIFLPIVTG